MKVQIINTGFKASMEDARMPRKPTKIHDKLCKTNMESTAATNKQSSMPSW